MLIGDSVTYGGRRHVVVGFTPASVTPALIELRNEQTGATFWIERRLVMESDAPQRAALRLIRHRPTRGERPD